MNDLTGKRALVVGGTGGIGAATAATLLAHGAQVAVTWRRRAGTDTDATVARLTDQGFVPFEADVTDTASLLRLRDDLSARFGGLDILVNAAGSTQSIPLADLEALTDAAIDAIFVANWRGQYAVVRELAPLLRASEDALVVFLSSIAGQNGVGSNIAYAAAKAGIDTLVKSLARVLAPRVRVLAVSPGVVATDFVPGRDAEALARVAQGLPLRRVATAQDIADAVLACATHLRYATGTTLTVDGGRLL